MKRKLLDILICPACLPDEVPLGIEEAEARGGEVIEGTMPCGRCGSAYPIRNGVARVVPGDRDRAGGAAGRYEGPDVLSAYLWSHYADLFNDPDASPAYTRWAGELSIGGGAGLDAGCAAGRFTFEMARKCDFAIGIDRSEVFIRTAREILGAGRLVFRVLDEGRIRSEREIILPEAWRTQNVEFIVADAHALPFRSGAFTCVASLNLVDKVPGPLDHVLETNRVARSRGAQLLISDPFSWSEEVSPPENWLGGMESGEFAGPAIENISRLLAGEGGKVSPPWSIARRGSVWWKIRNHSNHFELIRSLYIKAER
ncbi:MAG: methyltransferase domain-containing protein [Syntrophobacteraceae bacterium]